MQPPGGGAPFCSSRRPASMTPVSAVQRSNQSGSDPSIRHCRTLCADCACQLGHRLLLAAPGTAQTTSGWHGHPPPPALHSFTPLAGAPAAQGPWVKLVTPAQRARHSFSYCVPLAHTGAKFSMQAQPPPGTARLGATGLDGACSLRPGASAQHTSPCFKQPSGRGWFRHFALQRCCLRHAEAAKHNGASHRDARRLQRTEVETGQSHQWLLLLLPVEVCRHRCHSWQPSVPRTPLGTCRMMPGTAADGSSSCRRLNSRDRGRCTTSKSSLAVHGTA